MRLLEANKTETDCGVVGAFNAAQWCGIECTYEEVLEQALSAGYSSSDGMYAFQFANLLNKLGVQFKKISPKSPESMLKRLRKGNMLVVFYLPTGDGVGHVLSCLTDYEGKAFIVNPEKKRSSERRTWTMFIKDIETNGMKEFHVYEIPGKRRIRLATRNDDSRTA